MKLYFINKATEGDKDEQINALGRAFEFTELNQADWIYCASITYTKETIKAKLTTRKPLAVYCWDYYTWAHKGEHPGAWDWKEYAELLKMADVVFVPSTAQKRKLSLLLDVSAEVIHTGIKHLDLETSDENFILDPMRYYPEENRTWAEEAAEQLGIPIIHTEHQYSDEEFKKLIATCSFMTSAYLEASTGGLTLMEGLSIGKVSLVSNSPYQGASDYLGDLGEYFQYNKFENLLYRMAEMWEKRPTIDRDVALQHLKNYTFEGMAEKIYESLHRYK